MRKFDYSGVLLGGAWIVLHTACGTAPVPAFSADMAVSHKSGGLDCATDNRLDEPMSFEVAWLSSHHAEVTARGGTDSSDYVEPNHWYVQGDDGRSGTFPVGVFSDHARLRTVHMEALLPGLSYQITLESRDRCLNVASVTRSVRVPLSSPFESIAPVITGGPEVVSVNLSLGSAQYLRVMAEDDTAIRRVSIALDGVTTFRSGDYLYDTLHIYMEGDASRTLIDGSQFGFYLNPGEVNSLTSITTTTEDVYGNVVAHAAQLTD